MTTQAAVTEQSVPALLFHMDKVCADIFWEPRLGSHKDFNYAEFERGLDRLADRIRKGGTIVAITVTTTGEGGYVE